MEVLLSPVLVAAPPVLVLVLQVLLVLPMLVPALLSPMKVVALPVLLPVLLSARGLPNRLGTKVVVFEKGSCS